MQLRTDVAVCANKSSLSLEINEVNAALAEGAELLAYTYSTEGSVSSGKIHHGSVGRHQERFSKVLRTTAAPIVTKYSQIFIFFGKSVHPYNALCLNSYAAAKCTLFAD